MQLYRLCECVCVSKLCAGLLLFPMQTKRALKLAGWLRDSSGGRCRAACLPEL